MPINFYSSEKLKPAKLNFENCKNTIGMPYCAKTVLSISNFKFV